VTSQPVVEAAAEITGVLIGGVRRTGTLRRIARRTRELSGAELVLILLADPSTEGRYRIEVADGVNAALTGRLVAAEFPAERCLLVDDLAAVAEWPGGMPAVPATIVPLVDGSARLGVLIAG
jgi:hypothetical protein